jgi:hypothetical protein
MTVYVLLFSQSLLNSFPQTLVQVTRYLDDITVRGSRYVIREIGLSMSLSQIQWGGTCILVMIIKIVGGVIVLGVCLFIMNR